MRYARVVVDVAPAHLDRPFDYLVPEGVDVDVGRRVRVRFSGRRRSGWVVGTGAEATTDPDRVRELDGVAGRQRWFDAADLPLFRWVAERYAGTLADVLRHALPPRVAAVEDEAAGWGPPAAPSPAERPPCPGRAWRAYRASALLQATAGRPAASDRGAFWWRPLPGDDVAAMVCDLVARCLSAGRSALVLVPDRASPLPAAVLAAAGGQGVDLRGSDRERCRAFLRCRGGHARVAVGERGAVFAPLRELGLVVVADEANPAYKERRAPRHHARDVALARARLAGAVAVCVGDLPSARLWRLVTDGHVSPVTADRATERRRAPLVEVVDRSDPSPATRYGRLSRTAAKALNAAVRAGGVGVVVAARGGEGSALACRGCRARLACPVCDGSLRPRRAAPARVAGADAVPEAARVWECPTCAWSGPAFACPRCGDARSTALAAGAGRLARELARSHPDAEVTRMEGFDAPGPSRRPAVAVMTRGSVVVRPGWLGDGGAAVVVLPDADAFVARPRLEAAEDALRLWMAVGRWTGRVVLQTREPAHPAVQALVRWDPEGFWEREAPRRAELAYPPAAALVRLSARQEADEVAVELRAAMPEGAEVLGPDPDGALLVKTADLRGTLGALTPLRHAWSKAGRKVVVDVDPVGTE